jgi:hypothetical protein
LSQYLDVYDDSDFLDYVDDFYPMHKVDVPVGRYTSCTAMKYVSENEHQRALDRSS